MKCIFQVTQDEKNKISNDLIDSTHDITNTNITTELIFKLPFSLVPSLVKSRKVYINKGSAYISIDDGKNVLPNIFKDNLMKALMVSCTSTRNYLKECHVLTNHITYFRIQKIVFLLFLMKGQDWSQQDCNTPFNNAFTTTKQRRRFHLEI